MTPWLSTAISLVALLISGITAWLTFFKKGQLAMTQPTLIFFGFDGLNFEEKKCKIYLRTLLYSTSKRGQMVESLHVSLQRNESRQNFNIWVYGERGDLKRGSGLYVPQEGVTYDHHFLLPHDESSFSFLKGTYILIVSAKLAGSGKIKELSKIEISINAAQAQSLLKLNSGIFFDWGPNQQAYNAHIDQLNPVREEI